VQGDAVRLQQVFGNLLGNAVKFTPQDGTVSVALTTVDGSATVVLEDSGIGIAPEQLPRIFEPFQQAGEASGRQHGLGLGLAIARHLIESHGGTIRADSGGTGQGARFTISLPLDPDSTERLDPVAPGGLASAR
jgi:signal transduction histidine kinase